MPAMLCHIKRKQPRPTSLMNAMLMGRRKLAQAKQTPGISTTLC